MTKNISLNAIIKPLACLHMLYFIYQTHVCSWLFFLCSKFYEMFNFQNRRFHVVYVGDIYTTQSFLTIKRHNMASLDLTSIKSSAL